MKEGASLDDVTGADWRARCAVDSVRVTTMMGQFVGARMNHRSLSAGWAAIPQYEEWLARRSQDRRYQRRRF